jgi:ribosomal protein S18 acetylase RimI-like enzyme
VNIRPAGDTDRQAIAALHAASWRASYANVIAPDYLAAIDANMARHWAELLLGERDILLLAEDPGPVGFILAWDGEPGWVNTLHVLPQHRSGGVGAALMAAAARQLRGQGRRALYLDVLTTNTRAIAFYRRLGGVPGAVKDKMVGGLMLPNLRIDFPDLGTIITPP